MILHEYFKDLELRCKCGCGMMPDKESIENLYALRILFRKPIKITSAARCKSYNEKIGGSIASKHLIGAFDCSVGKDDEWYFIKLAQQVGFVGIGFKDNVFIHIDRHRSHPVVWGY